MYQMHFIKTPSELGENPECYGVSRFDLIPLHSGVRNSHNPVLVSPIVFDTKV